MAEGASILSEHQWMYTAPKQVTTSGCTSITLEIDQNADSWGRKGGAALWAECQNTVLL